MCWAHLSFLSSSVTYPGIHGMLARNNSCYGVCQVLERTSPIQHKAGINILHSFRSAMKKMRFHHAVWHIFVLADGVPHLLSAVSVVS